jgi:hypothetical protein
VPAAIYIIFQHLLASTVESRLAARFGDIDSLQAAATGSSGHAASRGHSIFKNVTVIVTSESLQNCGRSGCAE